MFLLYMLVEDIRRSLVTPKVLVKSASADDQFYLAFLPFAIILFESNMKLKGFSVMSKPNNCL